MSVVSLFFIPLFKLGTMADFCWNVSVPAFFVLMVLCIEYIIEGILTSKKFSARLTCMLIAISIASISTITQFAFGYKVLAPTGSTMCWLDDVYSLETHNFQTSEEVGDESWKYQYDMNFLAKDYQNTYFFKYIAKR